jgi:hypothetical protein
MECLILSLVKVMPKNRQRGQRLKGEQIELRDPRFNPEIMSRFGSQMINAIGPAHSPTFFVGARQLNQLYIAAGLANRSLELVHVQDIDDHSVSLNLEQALGVRYLATCFQLANPNFLEGHTETYGTIVGLQVRWLNHDELLFRPCRRVNRDGDQTLNSLLRGQMSYSTG